MCVQCGTPLALSTSGVADRERDYISAEIARGQTKQEILDGLVARFGPSVLALPERKGFSLAAYLVPALAVLAALVGIAFAAWRWRRPVVAAPHAPALADDDTRRIESELADLDD
ncbi:MAG: cytochrome c-type biogenesis protein [Solirubrobacterales bacterium]